MGKRNDWARYLTVGSAIMAQNAPVNFPSSVVPMLFRSVGMPLESFWMFSLISVPRWLKFLWGPTVDRVGSPAFGRRKSWIVPTTIIGGLLFALIATLPPSADSAKAMVIFLLGLAFIYAVQDTAVDAYRVEAFTRQEYPQSMRVSLILDALGEFAILFGTVLLISKLGWMPAVLMTGLFFIVFSLPVMVRKEEPLEDVPPIIPGSIKEGISRFIKYPDTKLTAPYLFLNGLIIDCVLIFAGPMLIDKGFSPAQVALVIGISFPLGKIIGSFICTLLIDRYGPAVTGLIGAVVGSILFLPFCGLAFMPPVSFAWTFVATLLATMAIWHFRTLIFVVRMGWSNRGQAATDFALQGTCLQLGATAMAAISGFLIARAGWPVFYGIMGVGIFGIGIITFLGFPHVERLGSSALSKNGGRSDIP